jgi:hypothetical protein
MKITNETIAESANIKKTTFYELKKKNPRQWDLIRKGVVAEMLLNPKVFIDYLKPTKDSI